jgi:hypothetical protein
MNTEKKPLYTLFPLEDFKAVLNVDDREDKLCRFCLVTSTLTIEQYCKRRLLQKKHFETFDYYGDSLLPLMEYPVKSMNSEQVTVNNGKIVDPKLYRVIPDCGTNYDFPYSIEFAPEIKRWRDLKYIKIGYTAGYTAGKIPSDLAAACMELASWNMGRYKGRRIGMTGNIKGTGIQGEHFELSMPENVRLLLEPYRRKVI